MLWPDGWGLWGRLTFHHQLKKNWAWGFRGWGQVCTGQTRSPRIPAPPAAGKAGVSQCLDVSAAPSFHRQEIRE